jgi:MFS transporter, DHA1 family, multidrug resistance protein
MNERRPTPWGLTILLGSLTAFAPMSIDMYLPALPAIARDLKAPDADVQLTLASFFIGLAIGQAFYGPLSDRIGRRGPLVAGIAFYVAATVVCAFASSITALIGLRFVQALGGCAGVVMARAVVRDRFTHQESAHIYSMLILVMGIAPILAPLLGGWVMAVAGWRAIFWFLAVFGAIVGLVVFFTLTESRPPSVATQARLESAFRAYALLMGNRTVMGYVLTGSFSSAALFAYIAASPDLIINTFGVAPADFGWIFGINAAGFIAASQVNRVLLRRYDADRILRVANVATLCVAVVLVAAAISGIGGMWGVLVPIFFVMGSFGFTQPNTIAGAMSVDPLRAGTTSSLFGTTQFSAGALAAAVTSLLHDGSAIPMTGVILVGTALSTVSLRTLVLQR